MYDDCSRGGRICMPPPTLPLLPMKVEVRKFIPPPLFCSLPSSSRRSISPHPPPLSPPPQSDDDGWRRRLDLLESERAIYARTGGRKWNKSYVRARRRGGEFFPKLFRRINDYGALNALFANNTTNVFSISKIRFAKKNSHYPKYRCA